MVPSERLAANEAENRGTARARLFVFLTRPTHIRLYVPSRVMEAIKTTLRPIKLFSRNAGVYEVLEMYICLEKDNLRVQKEKDRKA